MVLTLAAGCFVAHLRSVALSVIFAVGWRWTADRGEAGEMIFAVLLWDAGYLFRCVGPLAVKDCAVF